MKKYLLSAIGIIAIAAVITASCRVNSLRGEGNKIHVTPDVSAFNALDIDVPVRATITVQEGAKPSITLSGYENLVKHIKTRVSSNTLHVYTDYHGSWSIEKGDMVAEITVPSLTMLTMAGAPNAEVHGNITGNSLKVDMSGAGRVTLDNVNVDNFSTDVSGAAVIDVTAGTVKKAQYEVSGAGVIHAYGLQTQTTVAAISGAGKGEVNASQKLAANVSGAAVVRYKGHHADITRDVSGVGKVADAN